MRSLIAILFVAWILVGCEASPARVSTQTVQEVIDDVGLAEMSPIEVCEYIDGRLNRIPEAYITDYEWTRKWEEVERRELERRGYPEDYCINPAAAEKEMAEVARQKAYEAQWEKEVYNINLLRVTTRSAKDATECISGGVHIIELEGQISPDSSFAMDRLLERLRPCLGSDGKVKYPVTVSLQSGGGILNDGYAMGNIFRARGVDAVVKDGKVCASSCAVAFLGGAKRVVEKEGLVMFHAPYFTGENVYGKRDVNCDVGDEALAELRSYYVEMTDHDTGERILERTMWYCSAEDGWVIKGGSAAELYGIATEK